MSKVGFIGLGIMGTPMAGHLIKAGHEVYLYSIPSIPASLVEAGGIAWREAGQVRRPLHIAATPAMFERLRSTVLDDRGDAEG